MKIKEMTDADHVGEIRSLENERAEWFADECGDDWVGQVLWHVQHISNDGLRAVYELKMLDEHSACTCEFCSGKGGWSGQDSRGMDVDADCPMCDGKGWHTLEERDAAEREMEEYEHEQLRAWDDDYPIYRY